MTAGHLQDTVHISSMMAVSNGKSSAMTVWTVKHIPKVCFLTVAEETLPAIEESTAAEIKIIEIVSETTDEDAKNSIY